MRTAVVGVIAALAMTAAAACAQTVGAGEAAPRSTLDGVFDAAQADRGEATFQERCTACHAPGYFTTTAFRRSWSGRAVYYLFSTIRTTMPEDSPGSLRPREVADLLAYILRLNTYPEGPEPLPDETDALRVIIWEDLPADPGR
ncbi:MAG: cytochrome c [Gemmatimonadetes bacterium]|nr:cytochrome c [Gemmatimonadota bacterium]